MKIKIKGAFLVFAAVFTLANHPPAVQKLFAEDSTVEVEQAQGLSRAFRKAGELINPALVNISSLKKKAAPKRRVQREQVPPSMREFFGDELFDHFFGGELPDSGGGSEEGLQQMGLGSGFLIDHEGHILTNNHVVEGADEIKVRLYNKRVIKAEVVGTDPRTDLAVLKISGGSDLTPAVLGDSDKVFVGDWVIAAGNPLGLEHTITAGIVSAKGRPLEGDSYKYEDYIQTDAAINMGNSGGPLVDLEGRVIGINTAIATRTGGFMGIGFAIPINLAKGVLDSLISKGKVIRGWLGVAIQDLDEDLARSFDYGEKGGALVGDVSPGSPAAKAGIAQGDIVVRFDGKNVSDVNQFRNLVAATTPESSVNIEVVRDGKPKSIPVKVGELEDDDSKGPEKESMLDSELGLSVENITPEIARRLPSKTSGKVIVTAVSPFSLAANAGIQPGDIILRIGSENIDDADDFYDEVKKQDLQVGVRVVVESDGMKRFVFLKRE